MTVGEQLRVGGGVEVCPIVEAIKVIGRTWRLVVVRYLLEGPMSFNELQRRIEGISSKTLSQTLKQLQQAGVVRREVVSIQPFSVRYSLTEKGEALRPVIEALRKWGEEWLTQLETKSSPASPRE